MFWLSYECFSIFRNAFLLKSAISSNNSCEYGDGDVLLTRLSRGPPTLLKETLLHRYFSVNLENFSRKLLYRTPLVAYYELYDLSFINDVI